MLVYETKLCGYKVKFLKLYSKDKLSWLSESQTTDKSVALVQPFCIKVLFIHEQHLR